ncbi:MAG TPA: response regulator transcription factor [Ramlibacter sp.]|nr:response regulator transcription factor [Ramlibacter sp.]
MIRLLIADDHAIVRAGLRQLFALVEGIAVAGEAATGGQVLELLRRTPIDQVLLDMSMPGIDGADLVSRIRAHHPLLPILVLSMHIEPQIARRALKAGASGYVTKGSEPEMLVAAIRKIAAGGRFIEPALAEQMVFDDVQARPQLPHEQLTNREFQILSLLVRGAGVNEVADQLAISNKTVSTHKARLMRKMNFQSNAELVRYGVAHGLADE